VLVRPARLLERRRIPAASMARSDPGAPADPGPVHQVIREAPGPDRVAMDRQVRADQHLVDRADRATLDPTDRADRAARATLDPTDRTDRATLDPTDRADRAALAPTDRAVPADRVAHGMGTPSAATSTERRGETDPHPGGRARHRVRIGADRFRRPVDSG
jgi:hypothetical protein